MAADLRSDSQPPTCSEALPYYTELRSATNICPGQQTCKLWDNLCFDLDRQYIVLHTTKSKSQRTYGLCNVDTHNQQLRCHDFNNAVLTINGAADDQLTGPDDFGGTWKLLHRAMGSQPVTTAKGCATSTGCVLFGSTALTAPPTTRFHLRRVAGKIAQWYSWCTIGSEASGRKLDCAALDITNSARATVQLLANGTDSSSTEMTGFWSLYKVAQDVIAGPKQGCGPESCELLNGFPTAMSTPYTVVQMGTASQNLFQLCNSEPTDGPTKLRCHKLYPGSCSPGGTTYLTLDSAGPEVNMGKCQFNATWYLLQEPTQP